MTLVSTLCAILGARTDVELAVVFGSAARGHAHDSSDLDLAVKWRGAAPADVQALLVRIERACGRTVDLVDLELAPPQLRFEIARDGIVIAAIDGATWPAFRARAMVDWWDFRPIARTIHAAAIARLRETVNGSP